MAMRVDEAGQDELAHRVDDRVVRALRLEPAIGGADMGDPVALDNDERVRDRIAPLSVDQRPILDQQPRPRIRHDICLPIRATARLEQSRLDCHSDADGDTMAGCVGSHARVHRAHRRGGPRASCPSLMLACTRIKYLALSILWADGWEPAATPRAA